jgi:hypothetical protein
MSKDFSLPFSIRTIAYEEVQKANTFPLKQLKATKDATAELKRLENIPKHENILEARDRLIKMRDNLLLSKETKAAISDKIVELSAKQVDKLDLKYPTQLSELTKMGFKRELAGGKEIYINPNNGAKIVMDEVRPGSLVSELSPEEITKLKKTIKEGGEINLGSQLEGSKPVAMGNNGDELSKEFDKTLLSLRYFANSKKGILKDIETLKGMNISEKMRALNPEAVKKQILGVKDGLMEMVTKHPDVEVRTAAMNAMTEIAAKNPNNFISAAKAPGPSKLTLKSGWKEFSKEVDETLLSLRYVANSKAGILKDIETLKGINISKEMQALDPVSFKYKMQDVSNGLKKMAVEHPDSEVRRAAMNALAENAAKYPIDLK